MASPKPPRPALLSSALDDLGVTLGPGGGTLRVWSEAASAVELVLVDATDLDWITGTQKRSRTDEMDDFPTQLKLLRKSLRRAVTPRHRQLASDLGPECRKPFGQHAARHVRHDP